MIKFKIFILYAYFIRKKLYTRMWYFLHKIIDQKCIPIKMHKSIFHFIYFIYLYYIYKVYIINVIISYDTYEYHICLNSMIRIKIILIFLSSFFWSSFHHVFLFRPFFFNDEQGDIFRIK